MVMAAVIDEGYYLLTFHFLFLSTSIRSSFDSFLMLFAFSEYMDTEILAYTFSACNYLHTRQNNLIVNNLGCFQPSRTLTGCLCGNEMKRKRKFSVLCDFHKQHVMFGFLSARRRLWALGNKCLLKSHKNLTEILGYFLHLYLALAAFLDSR